MFRADVDPGTLQVFINDRAKYRRRVRHSDERLSYQVARADGLEGRKAMVTRQNHHQRLLDENTVSKLWHTTFPSKKRRIDFPFRQAVRKQRRVLARYHHVDVRQFIS